MQTLIVTLHLISCVVLVVLVLLQSGQQGMGVIFGGGGGSLFGSGGAGGILAKLTVGVAIIFFCTSLTFTYMTAKEHSTEPSSIVQQEEEFNHAPLQSMRVDSEGGREGLNPISSK
ncbi:preprotein translocase subunit SecG [Desulfonatronospira sp.]|uniref:preprotein translocase subunit SecG n=1 Tax=Desulfonatronospira sp. TaxID=1962951 RepID=UPI0025B9D4A9|nr:preprotein translocase subunit SecG [Desulfonatronospira sp.]